MAAVIQPQEGTAQVEYRLALPENNYLSFDPSRVSFTETTLHDNIYGKGEGTHVFRTSDPDFLSALSSGMANADPHLRFRLGFGTPENTYWLPWLDHIITNHYAKFEGVNNSAGHLIVIHSENNFTRMRRPNRVLTRKGKISDMAAAIAQTASMDSVIEETEGDFMLVQNFTDDVKFLFQRLAPRAINKKGVGGYLCFIRDNVLHFHTLDYQTTVKQIDYYTAFSTSFEANDVSQSAELWDAGLSGVNIISQDPSTGNSKEVASDPEKAIKLANSLYAFSSIEHGRANMPYHLGYNPVVELNALAQSAYQTARRQAFKTAMVLQKIISLRHGDLLNILLAQQIPKASDYAGYYLVAATTHSVKKGQVTSVYTLERGENQQQGGRATTQNNQNQLIPTTQAPGQSPNILTAQSSEATKGAGKSASAIFTPLTDPQTGQAS